MLYPYSNRNLFKEPESYFFAACDDPDFLDNWRDSRAEHIERLEGQCWQAPDDYPANFTPPILQPIGRYFARAVMLGEAELMAATAPYVVKYEVNKRLYAAYGRDHKRQGQELAGIADYLMFALALARLARGGRLNCLSTLLKLNDALCSVPMSNEHDAQSLVKILRLERGMVDALAV